VVKLLRAVGMLAVEFELADVGMVVGFLHDCPVINCVVMGFCTVVP
jgi:hypothetical protein